MADDDEDHLSRNKLRSELIGAGWPDSSSYTRGMRYAEKITAVQVHERFLNDLSEACLMGEFDRDTLFKLGPLAKSNLPKAMNLVGFVCSGEGGDETIPPLPDYWQWPVLADDPEHGG